ncbi:MAG: WD40 repeat domain-containing protein, partial [Nostoc sp.]
ANTVTTVAFSADGKMIASGSRDRTIKLWNPATGEEILTLTGHTNTVTSVTFSPDGKTLVSGSEDNTIKIWRLSQ